MIFIEILKLIALILIALMLFGLVCLYWVELDTRGIITAHDNAKEREKMLRENEKKRERTVVKGFKKEEEDDKF